MPLRNAGDCYRADCLCAHRCDAHCVDLGDITSRPDSWARRRCLTMLSRISLALPRLPHRRELLQLLERRRAAELGDSDDDATSQFTRASWGERAVLTMPLFYAHCTATLALMQKCRACRPGLQQIHFSTRCPSHLRVQDNGFAATWVSASATTLLFTHQGVRQHLDGVFKCPPRSWLPTSFGSKHPSPQTPATSSKDDFQSLCKDCREQDSTESTQHPSALPEVSVPG